MEEKKPTNGNEAILNMEKLVQDMPEDLKIAILAGCEVETSVDENGKFSIKTKYPVAVVRDKDGKPVKVIQKTNDSRN